MKIEAVNGFYKFYPESIGELVNWEKINDQKLVNIGDAWTYSVLADFPNYSFTGWLYNLNIFTTNYAGDPVEVMKRNRLTYSIMADSIVPTFSVFGFASYGEGLYISSPTLPQCYTYDKDQKTITGFLAFWDMKFNQYKIERFYYESV